MMKITKSNEIRLVAGQAEYHFLINGGKNFKVLQVQWS